MTRHRGGGTRRFGEGMFGLWVRLYSRILIGGLVAFPGGGDGLR